MLPTLAEHRRFRRIPIAYEVKLIVEDRIGEVAVHGDAGGARVDPSARQDHVDEEDFARHGGEGFDAPAGLWFAAVPVGEGL